MQSDHMLEFLHELKTKNPQLVPMLDVVEEAYQLTSMPKLEIDCSFLRYPPGHYYSPLPSQDELARVAPRAFGTESENLPGVDLRERDQLRLYADLLPLYKDIPFSDTKQEGLRYYYNNDFFCHADAIWLNMLMRRFQPRRIVEVGSGFSSCVMLDTNERFLNRQTTLTFIEPYPERLLQNCTAVDAQQINILQQFVQDVPLETFDQLEANDILFIDSSHVGKIGSDVLWLLHKVLPRLKSGVLIHVHDIFYPFVYPKQWYEVSGRAWNECHFLHTFLQYNAAFEILLFGNWLGIKHAPMLQKNSPLCMRDIGGSLWLRRV